MNNRLALARQRRQLLVLRAQAQRLELAAITQHWQKPLAFADTLVLIARDAQRVWSLYALASMLYIKLRRHRLGLWIAIGCSTWGIWRYLHGPTRSEATAPEAKSTPS